jgi:hypothetical protein
MKANRARCSIGLCRCSERRIGFRTCDFEEYLLPSEAYRAIKLSGLAVDADCSAYLQRRSEQLDAEFLGVDRLDKAGELPEASIVDGVLKIMPPDDQEPEQLEQLTRQAYAMLPRGGGCRRSSSSLVDGNKALHRSHSDLFRICCRGDHPFDE